MDEQTSANIIELANRMKATGKRKFLIQMPEGLKTKAFEIIFALEKEGFEIIYAADPTYGACDLALEEARLVNVECLVHIGHSKFYVDFETPVPVIYFPWRIKIDFDGLNISEIKERKLGLVSTIQHTDVLEKVKEYFEQNGKSVVIAGQILGCWNISAQVVEDDVEAFVFIGSGNFHPLALKNGSKPVYIIDIEQRNVRKLDAGLVEKRRWASIYNAKNAKTFGILISTKEGQKELLGVAEQIRKKIEGFGKKAVIMIMDEITENKLKGIRVDAFINTACPRILDDVFSKPMINATDIDEVLKEE